MGDPLTKSRVDRKKKGQPHLVLVQKEPVAADTVDEPVNLFQVKWFRTAVIISTILFFILTILALGVFGSDNFYTLKRGEDAYSVSGKFNIPLNVLLELNELQHASQMKDGDRIKIPTVHDIHIVRDGETLYQIAKDYGIKRYDLIKYNRINGTAKLTKGDRLYIPRVLSDIQISASIRTGLVPFNVMLNIDTNTRDRIRSYQWELGDGTTSANRNPSVIYSKKGTYYVRLTVEDENSNVVTSNTIPVVARELAHIGFNAPTFVTVNKNDVFSLETTVIDNLNNTIEFDYPISIVQNPKLLKQKERTDEFEIIATGYSKVTFQVAGYEHTSYFFVSPVPTVHVPEPDLNWYKTQHGTGLNGNCGPASISMGIQWARGLEIPVRTLRTEIGMPYEDGSITFHNMIDTFRRYKVTAELRTVSNVGEIRQIIAGGNPVIILLHTSKLEKTKGKIQTSVFGRYYTDEVGHYMVLKGFSEDGNYFAVYDPIPGDWYLNRIRYSDGVSMIGKNRYYPADEVFAALKTRTLVVIYPDG